MMNFHGIKSKLFIIYVVNGPKSCNFMVFMFKYFFHGKN